MLVPLPIDEHVPRVHAALAASRAAVLVAAPGAGKTTRVPPALLASGRVLVLQPRRVAVRAVATRIAEERGWTLGDDVGWQIRFERRFTPATPLVVVTEGILTARLQQDPLLSDVATVVLDEFHERSLHADLGLALVRQAWLARSDLRVLVMSATLDPAPIAAFLGGCPVIDVPGAQHPLEIEYRPADDVATAVRAVWPRTRGDVLAFLPGAREIAHARGVLASSPELSDVAVVPLHGSLDAAAQDAPLRPSDARRVILATNVAETSLTVPGVSTVVDSGLVKVARYDAGRGIDALVTERVTADSADQRAGRAARLGPGLACRLWDARDRLRPSREPDVRRMDVAAPALDVLAWGANPWTFEWFEAPREDALAAGLTLLQRLGAVEGEVRRPVLTALGRRLQRLPVHPRLARVLLAGGGTPNVAAACALLAEARTRGAGDGVATSCDLLRDLDRWSEQPLGVKQLARELARYAGAEREAAPAPEAALREALHAGFADRLARRRAAGSDRLLLASGHGATLGRESGVRDAEFVVALDVTAAPAPAAGPGRRSQPGPRERVEAVVRVASAVDPAWIRPTSITVDHRLDRESGRVRAVETARLDAVIVRERPVSADPDVAAAILAEAWLARPHDEATLTLLRRAGFAALTIDLAGLVHAAARAAERLDAIDPLAALPAAVRHQLDRDAPNGLPVPSGRQAPLDYLDDGSVVASVKVQELFGLSDTPKLGPRQVPVTFSLLAPNGRPVQTTRDLRSFWRGAYQEVRRELRGRYPKHPWPEDPWTAVPTHKTTRSLRK